MLVIFRLVFGAVPTYLARKKNDARNRVTSGFRKSRKTSTEGKRELVSNYCNVTRVYVTSLPFLTKIFEDTKAVKCIKMVAEGHKPTTIVTKRSEVVCVKTN